MDHINQVESYQMMGVNELHLKESTLMSVYLSQVLITHSAHSLVTVIQTDFITVYLFPYLFRRYISVRYWQQVRR